MSQGPSREETTHSEALYLGRAKKDGGRGEPLSSRYIRKVCTLRCVSWVSGPPVELTSLFGVERLPTPNWCGSRW